ncbi:hypothetical protein EME01_24290 [Sinorhizobium meliloti]|nr:hypothetical protein EME01_24290 [Sinorhizobium meliloti]
MPRKDVLPDADGRSDTRRGRFAGKQDFEYAAAHRIGQRQQRIVKSRGHRVHLAAAWSLESEPI